MAKTLQWQYKTLWGECVLIQTLSQIFSLGRVMSEFESPQQPWAGRMLHGSWRQLGGRGLGASAAGASASYWVGWLRLEGSSSQEGRWQ